MLSLVGANELVALTEYRWGKCRSGLQFADYFSLNAFGIVFSPPGQRLRLGANLTTSLQVLRHGRKR